MPTDDIISADVKVDTFEADNIVDLFTAEIHIKSRLTVAFSWLLEGSTGEVLLEGSVGSVLLEVE